MNQKLQNYLRTYRKRSGLTQKEVAFLLGSGSRTRISRYERNKRRPCLEALIAYEVIFGTSSRHLFEGMYLEIAKGRLQKAQLLLEHLNETPASPMRDYKITFLRSLLDREQSMSDVSDNHHVL